MIIKIYNCIHNSHIVSSHLLPKCCKEKEPEDVQLCIAVHTIDNNICEVNPLEILSNKSKAKQALPYIMGSMQCHNSY